VEERKVSLKLNIRFIAENLEFSSYWFWRYIWSFIGDGFYRDLTEAMFYGEFLNWLDRKGIQAEYLFCKELHFEHFTEEQSRRGNVSEYRLCRAIFGKHDHDLTWLGRICVNIRSFVRNFRYGLFHIDTETETETEKC
jgi:hypothetical protein